MAKKKAKKVIDPVADEVRDLMENGAPAMVLPSDSKKNQEQPEQEAAPRTEPTTEQPEQAEDKSLVPSDGEDKKPTTIEQLDPALVPDEAFQLFNLMRRGYTESELRVMFKDWKLKKFKALIKRARDLQTKAVLDREAGKADAASKYMDLYRKASEIGNLKEQKNILDSYCKLMGYMGDVNFADGTFVVAWRGAADGK